MAGRMIWKHGVTASEAVEWNRIHFPSGHVLPGDGPTPKQAGYIRLQAMQMHTARDRSAA
jgi:hypothetical protein